jgi:hypothetical protein
MIMNGVFSTIVQYIQKQEKSKERKEERARGKFMLLLVDVNTDKAVRTEILLIIKEK